MVGSSALPPDLVRRRTPRGARFGRGPVGVSGRVAAVDTHGGYQH
ncbi:hypothetical protein GJR88_00212 [Dietzia sp. DQ12-45-1b]|nr:hypothetical protein GJR88_00212 [Dietzia sp. DQ12-45-1b]